MADTQRTFSLLLMVAALVAWAGCAVVPASAQRRESPASPKPSQRRKPPHDRRGGPPPGGGHRPDSPLGQIPGANLFRPLPEDQGPLTPAEERELVNFVRKHVPNAYQMLRKLRRRDPVAFQRRLDEAAPRLRQLRRIFKRNPQLGKNIIQHVENLRRLQRARQLWSESDQNPQHRRRIQAEVRRILGQNLRIEAAVLDDRVQGLEQQREARIEAEVQRLLAADVELAGEPRGVRELVRRLRAARPGDDLEWLESELWRTCSERLDHEVVGLRDRAARLRTSAPEEVDHRMRRFLAQAERGPLRHAAPKRSDDRKGDKVRKRGRPPGRRP